jgi:hypothetical protein
LWACSSVHRISRPTGTGMCLRCCTMHHDCCVSVLLTLPPPPSGCTHQQRWCILSSIIRASEDTQVFWLCPCQYYDCFCANRFQYIDFLHYPWVAQMINQFENTEIYIFLDIEVCPALLQCLPAVMCTLKESLSGTNT